MVQRDDASDAAREWNDAIESVIAFEGTAEADRLLTSAVETARRSGAKLPFAANTAYINTIAPSEEAQHPGDRALEHRIRSAIRWNALAIVLKANKTSSELGGIIASFQSAATLYDTGFQLSGTRPRKIMAATCCSSQGHSSPGIYARAFVEGRLTEEQLLNFRQEVDGKGLSSYPHPWLMPDFWQFPTVSMASARSWASTRRASSSICITAALPTPPNARSGCFAATARWTSRRAWAPFRWQDARSSTTSSSSSTATCSASTVPCAATQDHPGTRG